MKTYGCALCSVKRPAGALYIVKPLAGGPRLICWWCVESVGKMVKESPQDRRKGEEGKAYWCKVD